MAAAVSSSSLPAVPVISRSNRRQLIICKAVNEASLSPSPPILSKRSLCISSVCVLALAGKGHFDADAAILEADDDEELLEKVKRDRKKRIERQGVIKSSIKETAYLQDLVYKLSKVGQAIENKDLSAASSVLGPSTDTEWVSKINSAFNKLSSSPEEKTEVDNFNSSLSSLISSVSGKDIEASKKAFVASASALEKWTVLTGVTSYSMLYIGMMNAVSGKDIEASKKALVASASAIEKWTVLTGLNEQLKGL